MLLLFGNPWTRRVASTMRPAVGSMPRWAEQGRDARGCGQALLRPTRGLPTLSPLNSSADGWPRGARRRDTRESDVAQTWPPGSARRPNARWVAFIRLLDVACLAIRSIDVALWGF